MALALAIGATSCGRGRPVSEPTVTATATTPATTPSPISLPGSSCEEQQGGSSENTPDFVAVRAEHEPGIDRVVFRFRLNQETTEPPSFSVRFTDEFIGPEGNPVHVDGTALVAVSFGALGVDLTSETPAPIYTGPKDLRPALPNLKQLKELEDFEATITWGLGLARRGCFRLRATATELAVEFPSP